MKHIEIIKDYVNKLTAFEREDQGVQSTESKESKTQTINLGQGIFYNQKSLIEFIIQALFFLRKYLRTGILSIRNCRTDPQVHLVLEMNGTGEASLIMYVFEGNQFKRQSMPEPLFTPASGVNTFALNENLQSILKPLFTPASGVITFNLGHDFSPNRNLSHPFLIKSPPSWTLAIRLGLIKTEGEDVKFELNKEIQMCFYKYLYETHKNNFKFSPFSDVVHEEGIYYLFQNLKNFSDFMPSEIKRNLSGRLYYFFRQEDAPFIFKNYRCLFKEILDFFKINQIKTNLFEVLKFPYPKETAHSLLENYPFFQLDLKKIILKEMVNYFELEEDCLDFALLQLARSYRALDDINNFSLYPAYLPLMLQLNMDMEFYSTWETVLFSADNKNLFLLADLVKKNDAIFHVCYHFLKHLLRTQTRYLQGGSNIEAARKLIDHIFIPNTRALRVEADCYYSSKEGEKESMISEIIKLSENLKLNKVEVDDLVFLLLEKSVFDTLNSTCKATVQLITNELFQMSKRRHSESIRKYAKEKEENGDDEQITIFATALMASIEILPDLSGELIEPHSLVNFIKSDDDDGKGSESYKSVPEMIYNLSCKNDTFLKFIIKFMEYLIDEPEYDMRLADFILNHYRTINLVSKRIGLNPKKMKQLFLLKPDRGDFNDYNESPFSNGYIFLKHCSFATIKKTFTALKKDNDIDEIILFLLTNREVSPMSTAEVLADDPEKRNFVLSCLDVTTSLCELLEFYNSFHDVNIDDRFILPIINKMRGDIHEKLRHEKNDFYEKRPKQEHGNNNKKMESFALIGDHLPEPKRKKAKLKQYIEQDRMSMKHIEIIKDFVNKLTAFERENKGVRSIESKESKTQTINSGHGIFYNQKSLIKFIIQALFFLKNRLGTGILSIRDCETSPQVHLVFEVNDTSEQTLAIYVFKGSQFKEQRILQPLFTPANLQEQFHAVLNDTLSLSWVEPSNQPPRSRTLATRLGLIKTEGSDVKFELNKEMQLSFYDRFYGHLKDQFILEPFATVVYEEGMYYLFQNFKKFSNFMQSQVKTSLGEGRYYFFKREDVPFIFENYCCLFKEVLDFFKVNEIKTNLSEVFKRPWPREMTHFLLENYLFCHSDLKRLIREEISNYLISNYFKLEESDVDFILLQLACSYKFLDNMNNFSSYPDDLLLMLQLNMDMEFYSTWEAMLFSVDNKNLFSLADLVKENDAVFHVCYHFLKHLLHAQTQYFQGGSNIEAVKKLIDHVFVPNVRKLRFHASCYYLSKEKEYNKMILEIIKLSKNIKLKEMDNLIFLFLKEPLSNTSYLTDEKTAKSIAEKLPQMEKRIHSESIRKYAKEKEENGDDEQITIFATVLMASMEILPDLSKELIEPHTLLSFINSDDDEDSESYKYVPEMIYNLSCKNNTFLKFIIKFMENLIDEPRAQVRLADFISNHYKTINLVSERVGLNLKKMKQLFLLKADQVDKNKYDEPSFSDGYIFLKHCSFATIKKTFTALKEDNDIDEIILFLLTNREVSPISTAEVLVNDPKKRNLILSYLNDFSLKELLKFYMLCPHDLNVHDRPTLTIINTMRGATYNKLHHEKNDFHEGCFKQERDGYPILSMTNKTRGTENEKLFSKTNSNIKRKLSNLVLGNSDNPDSSERKKMKQEPNIKQNGDSFFSKRDHDNGFDDEDESPSGGRILSYS